MVARGFAIVMTDYQGLGTPGLHTYVNRVAQGNAMLDAARAAKKLTGTSLKPDGPLAFWGYSQGGGAAASAAELASRYAPELKVVGTYAGAPHADLKELFPTPTAASSSAPSAMRSTR
jgi:alpha-beta hydrolase superfamily lysophospholipase